MVQQQQRQQEPNEDEKSGRRNNDNVMQNKPVNMLSWAHIYTNWKENSVNPKNKKAANQWI